MRDSVISYNSLTEFMASLPVKCPRRDRSDSWAGNQTYAEAKVNLWKGFPEATRRSEAILEQLESGIELRQESWDTDIIGYFPCVPAAIHDDPDCMFVPVDEHSNTTPMKVYASVCLSAGYESEQVESRGIAILALVRKLALIRPVELWVYAEMDTWQCCIRLETNPLDLTTASYVLANPAFLRKLCFNWKRKAGDIDWCDWFRGGVSAARDALGASGDDLVIPGSYFSSDDLSNPVEWVNTHVRKYALVNSSCTD